MMRQLFGWIALLAATVGCGSTKLETPTPSPNQALGLLEVTLDFTDELNPTTKTSFMPFVQSKHGLSLQSISGNSNETSRIALKRRNASFIDDNETALFGTQSRYVRATFDIANFSSRSFKNLNFMAISLNSQLGTMFTNLRDGSDAVVPLTDTVPTGELTYRALKPTHGMRLNGANLEVDPSAADMQVFSSTEADGVQTDLSGTYPNLQVLEYGYSARSLPTSTTSRSVGISPISADCSSTPTSPPNGYTLVANNVNCFTGRVTFAFKLPRKPVRGQNPFAFSFVFVVADETAPSTTQSLEEQTMSTQISREQVLALDVPFGEQRLHRTLPGSLAGLLNPAGVQSKMFCKVKTAVATPSLTADFLSRQMGVSNVLPSSNNQAASRNGSVQATFCDTMSAPSTANFVIQSFQTGKRSSSNGVYSGVGSTLSYAPSTPFKANEEIEVSLTNQLTRVSDGAALQPLSYRFRTATTPQGAAGFTLSNLVSLGNGATDLTTGDFNNDNKLDVVVLSSGKAAIYLGSGTGDFVAQSEIVLNINFRTIKAADLNGDGKLDLAALLDGSNNISVFLGSGTGSFGARVDFPTGVFPRGLNTADFNSDGKLDLVVSNFSADTISVLLGTGTGTFDTKVDYPTGDGPFAIAIGDINTDGKLDIAVTNYLSSTVSILLGNGTSGFNPKTEYANISVADDIVIGDFNGDTQPDIATKSYDPARVSILLGSQANGFSSPTTYIGSGNRFSALEIGDFNGDGKTDLAVRGQGDIKVLQNTGNSFAWQPSINVSFNQFDGGAMTTGDFNSDGRPDLATVTDGNMLNVFLKK